MGHGSWWADAVGYSIYLRSFADSDGDGVGDLEGLLARLDHLEALGVDLLWVSPFYPSPLVDGGYDVVDHTAVDPRLGDLATFDRLLAEVHRRGMRLVVDLVANHTSEQHPWFRDALADPDGACRDRYVWADPAPGGGPPNNWVSCFGGSAWSLDEASGQYYLHLFLPQQPDLNWRNEAVRDEFDRIVRFWLERGVDGLRVDVAQGLVKDARLRSNPVLTPVEPDMDRNEAWACFEHRHDVSQSESLDVFARWKAICAGYDAVVTGETSVPSPDEFAAFLDGAGLDVGFWLPPARLAWDAGALREALTGPLAAVADQRSIVWVASTLDEKRAATRFEGGELGRRRALALATILCFLPGVPFLYQGEELGLVDGAVPDDARVDPVGEQEIDSRDGCRTPMPWEPTPPSFGFSTSPDPWLPMGGRTDADTAAVQRGETGSWFERYRALLAVRRSTPALRSGGVEPLDLGDDLLAFGRDGSVVVANVGDHALPLRITGEVLYDTDGRAGSSPPSFLSPAQAVILRLVAERAPD